jgi:protein involved in polysaccharide export with SLBB domain
MQDFGGTSSRVRISDALASRDQEREKQKADLRAQKLNSLLLSLQHDRLARDEDYEVGPDDDLEIGVFALEQPRVRSVLERTVNADGLVMLPLVGDLPVAGHTTREIVKIISAAYEGKYLKDPQVTVAVKVYRSAPVVVTGAVQKPGVYYLRRNTSTVLEMLSEASGLAQEAGDELLIVRSITASPPDAATATEDPPAAAVPPAPPIEPEPAATTETAQAAAVDPAPPAEPEAMTPAPPAEEDTAAEPPPARKRSRWFWWRRKPTPATAAPSNEVPLEVAPAVAAPINEVPPDVAPAVAAATTLAETEPEDRNDVGRLDMVTVDLRRLLDAGDVLENATVLGGDVISVPPRKKRLVYVLGFVQKPGALEIPRGESVQALQAVAMAGGLSTAARAQNSTLITEKDGIRKNMPVDLTGMKRGSIPPVYLSPGDILIVGSSRLAKLAQFIQFSVGSSISPSVP